MNMQTTSEARALDEFLKVWSGDMSADVADKLTCAEVDALARLLRAHDHPAAAAEWINAHSHGDEEGDAHHRSAVAAMLLELDVVTATYPDLTQEFEDPEELGAGHVVLYALDGRNRFAITERCDKPAVDETREPIAWQWESAHRLLSGGWEADETGEVDAAALDTLIPRVWAWAGAHGGTRGR